MNMRVPFAGLPGRKKAFSLVELLVVIALLAVLAALVLPSIRSISSATELNISATAVVDALNLARQTALSTNRPVEVRFFEVPRSSGSALAFRAVGVYLMGDSGPAQVGKLTFLRANTVMSDTETFGTLLKYLPKKQAALPSIDPNASKTFNYRHFVFRPDGSANLASTAPSQGGDTWHVMLYDDRRAPNGQVAPDNHITIQLVPETGRPRIFQPSAG
jgi:uncharacterized protein (TIGR02596 family)